jgi:hypothetical protein
MAFMIIWQNGLDKKLDYTSRIIGGCDYPNPSWMPPPHGCITYYFINEDEIVNGKYKGVHVQKCDTYGEYAKINNKCHISKAWELMNAFRDEGKYAFDTESGRLYIKQHIFNDDSFNHDEKLSFNILMPVKNI